MLVFAVHPSPCPRDGVSDGLAGGSITRVRTVAGSALGVATGSYWFQNQYGIIVRYCDCG